VDQTGAIVKDAKVSILNIATGAVRDGVSGGDGAFTSPALSLTGAYKVTDADVEELKAAGHSEDEILEQTVSAAVAAGLLRLEAGLKALG